MGDSSKLEGKLALITGESSWGIGSSVALALASRGADIVINPVQSGADQPAGLEAKLSELCQTIGEMGRQATLFRTSITDPDAVKRMVEEISSDYRSVDILVNSGSSGLTATDIVEARKLNQDKLKIVKRERLSAIDCTVACLPLMRKNRWGRIINIGSSSVPVFMRMAAEMSQVVGLIEGARIQRYLEISMDFPSTNLFDRSAQVILTHEGLIDLCKENITVNSIEMGDGFSKQWAGVYDAADGFRRVLDTWQASSGWSQGDQCMPQDIADAVLFLCSDQARFITDAEIRFWSE